MNLGQWGEEKAAEYLIKRGYTILYRNFQCKQGEIDIIGKDLYHDGLIVFFEVKTRTSFLYGHPCEAITSAKRRRLRKTAQTYIALYKIAGTDFRMDAIEILLQNEKAYIRHTENAF